MPLPQLTPDADAGRVVSVPPPHFRPLGTVTEARWSARGSFNGSGLSAAQRYGIRYEQLVHVRFRNVLGFNYHRNPTLSFLDDGHFRKLVPDGLLFQPDGTAIIFEVKSQHMPEAWWQLRKLYEPVVKALPFVNRTSCIEVTRSYDPAMGFPEPITLYTELREAIAGPCRELKVLRWRP